MHWSYVFLALTNGNDLSMSQFCTWYDSYDFMTCGNVWVGRIIGTKIRIRKKSKKSLWKIWMMESKSINEIEPRFHWTFCCLYDWVSAGTQWVILAAELVASPLRGPIMRRSLSWDYYHHDILLTSVSQSDLCGISLEKSWYETVPITEWSLQTPRGFHRMIPLYFRAANRKHTSS